MEKNIYDVFDKMFTIYSYREVHDIILSFIDTLSSVIEEKDSYTYGHQKRTADYAIIIAEPLNFTQEELENLYLAARVHDVGKIRIPSQLLVRPHLMDIEMEFIKSHAEIGGKILKKVKYFNNIPTIVEQHHENLDGTGYPKGLKGEEICKEAKVLTVADVIDAMLSHRPYRAALEIEDVIKELKKNKGKKYDSDVVKVALKMLKKKANMATETEQQ